MFALGADIGNHTSKTSKNVTFRSTVRRGVKEEFASSKHHAVKWQGVDYVVGDEEGSSYTAVDKYLQDSYKVMLLTSIALSFPEERDITVSLGIGVPVTYYQTYYKKFNEAVKAIGKQTIMVDDEVYVIEIAHVATLPQSAVVLGKRKFNFPAVVIDIGGGTVDVSEWDIEDDGIVMVRKQSYPLGFEQILDEFANHVNTDTEIGADMLPDKMLKYIMTTDRLKTKTGVHNVTPFKKAMLASYVQKIHSSMLSDKFSLGLAEDIILTGGPAATLKEYFDPYFLNTNLVVDDQPQISNAKIFEDAARRLIKTNPTPRTTEAK